MLGVQPRDLLRDVAAAASHQTPLHGLLQLSAKRMPPCVAASPAAPAGAPPQLQQLPMDTQQAAQQQQQQQQQGWQPPAAYGFDAVGRAVRDVSQPPKWEARVLDYDLSTGLHCLAYTSSAAMAAASAADADAPQQGGWVVLTSLRFLFVTPAVEPNPSFAASPKGPAAVGQRLRVYWPAMGKWYAGQVRSFDPATDKHVVVYKVGRQAGCALLPAGRALATQRGGEGPRSWSVLQMRTSDVCSLRWRGSCGGCAVVCSRAFRAAATAPPHRQLTVPAATQYLA